MSNNIPFIVRKVYNFDVYPAALLGTSYLGVTVLSIMDPTTAAKEIDIQALHAQVYPTLPPGTPNDPTGYDYVKIQTITGQVTILGMAWINESTVVVVQSNTIVIRVNDVAAIDLSRIMNALVQNGYNNVVMSIE